MRGQSVLPLHPYLAVTPFYLMLKSAVVSDRFEFDEFEKLSALLESDEVFGLLTKLGKFSDSELLRQMVGDTADTRELSSSPESSKYPLAIAQIRLIQELKKVTRRIQVTRKLRASTEIFGE